MGDIFSHELAISLNFWRELRVWTGLSKVKKNDKIGWAILIVWEKTLTSMILANFGTMIFPPSPRPLDLMTRTLYDCCLCLSFSDRGSKMVKQIIYALIKKFQRLDNKIWIFFIEDFFSKRMFLMEWRPVFNKFFVSVLFCG